MLNPKVLLTEEALDAILQSPLSHVPLQPPALPPEIRHIYMAWTPTQGDEVAKQVPRPAAMLTIHLQVEYEVNRISRKVELGPHMAGREIVKERVLRLLSLVNDQLKETLPLEEKHPTFYQSAKEAIAARDNCSEVSVRVLVWGSRPSLGGKEVPVHLAQLIVGPIIAMGVEVCGVDEAVIVRERKAVMASMWQAFSDAMTEIISR